MTKSLKWSLWGEINKCEKSRKSRGEEKNVGARSDAHEKVLSLDITRQQRVRETLKNMKERIID